MLVAEVALRLRGTIHVINADNVMGSRLTQFLACECAMGDDTKTNACEPTVTGSNGNPYSTSALEIWLKMVARIAVVSVCLWVCVLSHPVPVPPLDSPPPQAAARATDVWTVSGTASTLLVQRSSGYAHWLITHYGSFLPRAHLPPTHRGLLLSRASTACYWMCSIIASAHCKTNPCVRGHPTTS